MSESTRSITLPSLGLLYGGKVPDGKVTIRKLGVDELSLFESQGDTWDRIDTLLKSCVKFPNGFSAADLLASDRFALLIALRNFTLPVKYPVNFKCRNCGASNLIKIDLATDLTVKMATATSIPADPEKGIAEQKAFSEPVSITLPDTGQTVDMKFIRAQDQAATIQYARRLKAQNPNDHSDPGAKHSLARQLVAVDGKAPQNLLQAEQFIGALPGLDILKIRKVMDEADVGVNTEMFADCKGCGHSNKFEMPFTEEFFRPTDL